MSEPTVILHLCTCVVITGGHRLPTSTGCPLHGPTPAPDTTGANMKRIGVVTLSLLSLPADNDYTNGTNTKP